MPIRDSYEPGRPCWVDLGTTDPAGARSFYNELFGWTADVDPRPEAGGYALFRYGGHAVAGCGPIMMEGMPPVWGTYIATADADATAAAVTGHGGTVLAGPMDVLDAGRMAFVAGPDGAAVGVWQAKAHVGATFVTEPGGWSWNQLATRDKAASEAFYTSVFGWTLRDHPEWGEHWALGDGEIAGVMEMGAEFPPQVPPHWQVVFMVTDADATMAKAQGMGASAHGPMMDMPMSGRMGALADPQGA